MNPSFARFLVRDLFGFVDGYNIYRTYFGLQRLDPSGLTCGKCCCCVDSVAFCGANEALTDPVYPERHFLGHYFEIHSRLRFKPGNGVMCWAVFWETERSVFGDPVATSDNIPFPGPRFPGSGGSLRSWYDIDMEHRRGDIGCIPESKREVAIQDKPRLVVVDKPAEPKRIRTLYFHIEIQSGKDCNCENKRLFWEGCQIISSKGPRVLSFGEGRADCSKEKIRQKLGADSDRDFPDSGGQF